MERTLSQGRWLWLDALKGLGIIAVVAGHVIDRDAARTIYLWHMPLFFFLAGVVFKPDADWRRFARDKAARLLVPYAVFLLLLSGPDLMAAAASGSQRDWMTFAVSRVAGGKTLYGWLAVFWFVTCLFLSQQVVNALVTRCRPAVVTACMLLFLALAFANQAWLPRAWLPWAGNVVLFAAPVLYLGHRLRPHLASQLLWLAVPLALAGLVLVGQHLISDLDLKNTRYGTPVVSLAFGLCVVLSLVALCRVLLQRGAVAKGLAFLGEASLLIMFTHMAIQQTLNERLGLHDVSLRIVVALAVPTLLYALLVRFDGPRRYLLGLAELRAPMLRSPLPLGEG
jgi:fucose 4-O-acetylase-like acetyltransferase